MESVAHEHEAFRSGCGFAQSRRRLVHGECGHRYPQTHNLSWPGLTRPSLLGGHNASLSGITGTSPVMTVSGSPAERALGGRHLVLGARIDRHRGAQRARQTLEAGLGDMVIVRPI